VTALRKGLTNTCPCWALKELDVIACPGRKTTKCRGRQVKMMYNFKKNATPEIKDTLLGTIALRFGHQPVNLIKSFTIHQKA